MPKRHIFRILETKNPLILQENVKIVDVAKALGESAESAALIHSGGRTVGIITEADIVRRVVARGLDPAENDASSIMTRDTVVIRPNQPLGAALYLMHEYAVRHIPVIEKGKPLGVISVDDALVPDLQEYAHNAEMLDHIGEIL